MKRPYTCSVNRRPYDSAMAQKRNRKVRSVTLSESLVAELLRLGELVGETRLSAMLDDAMRSHILKLRKDLGALADAPSSPRRGPTRD